jgi:ATP-dependent protease HslVU (ClpYQ) peptidase subunit
MDDFLLGKKVPPLSDRRSVFSFFLKLWKTLHERYSFVNDQCGKEEESPFGDLDASFLIINAGGIFYVGSDMSVTQFESYFAIGAGSDYSLGALYALYDGGQDAEFLARKAVEAGIAFDNRCGGPIEVKKISL